MKKISDNLIILSAVFILAICLLAYSQYAHKITESFHIGLPTHMDSFFYTVAMLLLVGMLIGFLYSRIKKIELFLLLILIYAVFMYAPSFKIPYIDDDCDHIASVSRISDMPAFISTMLSFQNEHFIPIVKIFYYLCYKFSGASSIPFHAIIILCFLSISGIMYKLLYRLTDSKGAAIFACALFGLSAIYSSSVSIIFCSAILFCIFFTIGTIYATYLYAETGKPLWAIIAFICGISAPATFLMGLLAVPWLILFYALCMKAKAGNVKVLLPAIIGWAPSAYFYITHSYNVIHASHYKIIGMASALDGMSFSRGAYYALRAVYSLIPNLTFSTVLSLVIFLGFLVCAVFNYHRMPWGKIIFFFLWILGNYAIITFFRSRWIERSGLYDRYNLFPALGLASVYALTFSAAFRRWGERISYNWRRAFAAIFIVMVATSAAAGYINNSSVADYYGYWNYFNIDFNAAIRDYIKEERLGQSDKLQLENKDLIIKNIHPRYTTIMEFAETILTADLKKHIVWGPKTDEKFIKFLKKNREKYPYFVDISRYLDNR